MNDPARWLPALCLGGALVNLGAAANDLCRPKGWWSYLFGALSLACAGVCVWAWRVHRRRQRERKERP